MWWIIILFFNLVNTQDSIEKFKTCNNTQCLLMQCYFPVSEFLNATQNEIKIFEKFIEKNHIFLSYHLCDELTVNSMDEVGACIGGVLFKFYQFDTNMTLQQRIHIENVRIQDEAIAIVIDTISKFLYRIKVINENKDFERLILQSKEDVVSIDADNLTPIAHLNISRIILNYGPWFTFVYSIKINNKDDQCLYRIYPLNNDIILPICSTDANIRKLLEKRMSLRKPEYNSIRSVSDLIHVNAFQRTLSTLFCIHQNSSVNLISNKQISIVSVNISNFNRMDIENHMYLHEPYPFYLFWSAKQNTFQRLGDQPSNELIENLINEDGPEENDKINTYGMFNDEVRYQSKHVKHIQINSNVLFPQNEQDYEKFREIYLNSAILFTFRWDSTSKLARQVFHQSASKITDFISMIDIDCYDWTDICNKENIFQWPTLILTKNGSHFKVYDGSTNENQLELELFRHSVNQPFLIEDDSKQTLIENILIRQQIIVIGQIQNRNEHLFNTYKRLVERFSDKEQIFFLYRYTDESSNLIIKEKYGDISTEFRPKTSIYKLNENMDYLEKLIINSLRMPLIPFDPIDFIKSDLSTFIVATRTQVLQLYNDILKDHTLIWIDTNSPWVLPINQYGHMIFPAMIKIDYTNGYVYVNSNLNDTINWLENIRMQTIKPFYELPYADIDDKPSQDEINFNKSNDDIELVDEYRLIHEESQKINEHGIGFDIHGLPIE